MGMLIDQFCEAVREWSRRTGEPEYGIPTFYVMAPTGGTKFRQAVGRVDPQTVAPERRGDLSLHELMGHYTLEQMREWLEELVHRRHMFEDFLIVALVRAIDDGFERMLEDYAKGIRRRRRAYELMEEDLADPERRVYWLKRQNESLPPGSEPITEADLRDIAQQMKEFSTPSLEEQRRARVQLDGWRELTAPILDSANIDEFHRRKLDLR